LSRLADNPFHSFGLIGVGAALAVFQKGATHAFSALRRRLVVTLEIPSKDPSYPWFLQWASRHGLGVQQAHELASSHAAATNTKSGSFDKILSQLAISNQLSVETTFQRRDNGSSYAKLAMIPAPGRHFLRYRSSWFQIERTRERTMVDLKSGTPWETVTITALARDKTLLIQMLEEAKQAALSAEEGKTVVYTSYGPDWRPFGAPRRRRELHSVVLNTGISDYIVNDVKGFLSNGKWYHERGTHIACNDLLALFVAC
jgi:chaperone BCS1